MNSNTYDPSDLIQKLKTHKDVFICGPSLGDTAKEPETHLRVYANGGRLCLIPTTSNAQIRTTFFDKKNGYLKYVPEEFRSELEEDYANAFTNNKRGSLKNINRRKEEFLKKHLPVLCNAVEKKFPEKERHIQTSIARDHDDFQKHDGTVVCDFEMTAPKSWYKQGSSHLKTQEEKNPKCDLVTFSCAQNPWVISVIELKCNKKACKNEKSGLSTHAREMTICMENSNQIDYIQEILRRLEYMLRFGLLKNAPDGLETQIKELSKSNDPERIKKQIHLCSCFLFTGDQDIPDAETAAALCQKAEYLQEHPQDFFYQFQEESSKVDLSEMQSWDDFLKS